MNSDNQRTGVGNVYDGNGNPTTYVVTGLPTYSITYDPENRPLSIGSGWHTSVSRIWEWAPGLRPKRSGNMMKLGVLL